MRKYFMTMAVIAIFAIGFAASDDTSSSTSSETTKVQEPKKNPNEKFAGTYVMYDDTSSGNEVFVTEDGRLFYKNPDGSNVKCGDIYILSDNAFEVTLGKDFYAFGSGKVWSYKNGRTLTCTWKIEFLHTIVFDLSENKLYVSKSEYKNRDYESPEYYKFRFTKK